MGTYVNPKGMSKEQWLGDNAVLLPAPDDPTMDLNPSYDLVDNDTALICLVDNGPFTAALVVDNRYDYDGVVLDTRDTRPRRWYLVEKSLLAEVT